MSRSMRVPARSEEGSAIVEFIVIGVAVMVPLVYLVQCVMTLHSAALASTQAVREAGRAFSTSSNEGQARQRAAAAARLAFADQGMPLPPGSLDIECPEGACLTPGSVVDVKLDWRVPLPWLPADWTGSGRASVSMSARQRVPVDDYRSSPDGAA